MARKTKTSDSTGKSSPAAAKSTASKPAAAKTKVRKVPTAKGESKEGSTAAGKKSPKVAADPPAKAAKKPIARKSPAPSPRPNPGTALPAHANPAPTANGPFLTAAERHARIARAAYLRAEALGFRTDSYRDWLIAEAEVDAQLRAAGIRVVG